jgi:hypothetical protein
MKDDVDVPAEIPRKRRALEGWLDKWIAVWLARDDLTPFERRRLEVEKKRRRKAQPDVKVGIVIATEGLTPEQRDYVTGFLVTSHPTELHVRLGDAPRLRKAIIGHEDVAATAHPDHKDVVRAATVVVAAPKEPERPDHVEGVWEAVRFAKHRKTPVRIVMPNGEERT